MNRANYQRHGPISNSIVISQTPNPIFIDHCCIIFSPTQEPQGRRSPGRRSMHDYDSIGGLLPTSDHNKLAEKWIHSIPLILLLILVILWWFSYPVNLEIKDGGIRAIHASEFLEAPKYIDHVELAILGDAGMLQIASCPRNLTSGGARGSIGPVHWNVLGLESRAQPKKLYP